MERKVETSRKVSPMATKLRCITNLNDPPINPLKKKRLCRKNEFTKFLARSDAENKDIIKPPDPLPNKINVSVFPTRSPLKYCPRFQTVKELIQNKENYEKNEIYRKSDRKSTLPARNILQKRPPVTNCVEIVNLRRIADQSCQSPQEKIFRLPISHNLQKSSDCNPHFIEENRDTNEINSKFEEPLDGYDQSLCEGHSHNKTINEIPHFDEYFQLGRKTAIGRLMKDHSEISLHRPTLLAALSNDDSCNKSSCIKNVSDILDKRGGDDDDCKMILKDKRYFDPDLSCEFIMDKHAEMLMDIVQNEELLNHLCEFFGFKELCNFWQCSRRVHEKTRTFKKHLRNLIIKIGISNEVRANYWLCTSRAYKIQNSYKNSYYYDLTFVSCTWEKEIKKDIDRTFNSNKIFQEKQGQLRLYRVLRAFAIHYKNIGYIQGVNYLAATLLNLYNESDSFFILSALFDNCDLKSLYDSQMEGLKTYVQMFDYLMDLYFPDLYEYLQSQDISSSHYFTQWISTLFSYDLSREMVFKIWDLFLIDGWKIIYKIALAIMKSKRQKIYKVAPENILTFLRQIHKKSDFDMDKLISDTTEIEISNRLLKDLKEKICSGANLKRVRLRFDLKKGKRFWEFQESIPSETADKINKVKNEDDLKQQNLLQKNTKDSKRNTNDSKKNTNILTSFFGVLRSQFDFSNKPEKISEDKSVGSLDEKNASRKSSIKITQYLQESSKKIAYIAPIELPSIEIVTGSIQIESLEGSNTKSLNKQVVKTPQYTGTKIHFLEKSFSQKALISNNNNNNIPPKTYR